MDPKKQFYETLATSMIEKFKKRQIDAYYCATKEEAVALATSMLPTQATVGFGGSMTLTESGMMAALQNKTDITLYDRSKAATPEETTAIYHQCLNADYYFMSSNTITSDGLLVNIDGNGNRVAALIYGPKEVIVMAGMNKVVKTVDEALDRVHNTATPANCIRLNKKTPCALTGMCADCLSPECICNQVVITRRSGIPGRIKVILIGEELGY